MHENNGQITDSVFYFSIWDNIILYGTGGNPMQCCGKHQNKQNIDTPQNKSVSARG